MLRSTYSLNSYVLRGTPYSKRASVRLKTFLSLILFSLFTWSFGFCAILYAQVSEREMKDQDIVVAIEGALMLDPLIPGHLLDVRVDKGTVQISGYVSNLRARTRALNLAKTFKGVQSVINLIIVKKGLKTDQQLTHDVMQALQEDSITASYDVGVEVSEGKIHLSGTVPSRVATKITIGVASEVDGVVDVEDNLIVKKSKDRTDIEITDEIRARLEMDVWVYDSEIEVEVKNGRVTLSGNVRSLAEKDRAIEDAWVDGVDTVMAQELRPRSLTASGIRKGEKFRFRTDKEIETAISRAFHYDPRLSSSNIEILVNDKLVTLTGIVKSYQSKKIAELNALNTVGVQSVNNLIKVRPSPNLSMNDQDLKTTVRQRLANHTLLATLDLTVSVNDAEVWLHGRVESIQEKVLAESLVSRIKAVANVKNHIKIDPTWSWQPDWRIMRNIQNELWWSPFIDSEQLSVTVKDGVANLSGQVSSWVELSVAIENAFEGGAKAVRNMITVGDQPSEGSEIVPEFIRNLPAYFYE